MNARRRFFALGAGLTASLFTSGHSRPHLAHRDPVANAVSTPPDFDAGAGIGSRELAQAAPLNRGSYAAPVADLHPENNVLDQVASEPIAPLAPPDVVLSGQRRVAFDSALARLRRLQDYVGFGNFNVIGWDQSLKLARKQAKIGAFTPAELDLIEEMFFTDARTLGFYGDKVVANLSDVISRRDIQKIPASGHYLFKGTPTATYQRIRRDLGDTVILTSGIRGVVKQIYLFMNKAAKVDGNLSLASYSLAPPGHSYHAIGDFDVGKKGFGARNFSEAFAETDEFKRLIDLGYLDIRYPEENPFGVRYEPWHIKVV